MQDSHVSLHPFFFPFRDPFVVYKRFISLCMLEKMSFSPPPKPLTSFLPYWGICRREEIVSPVSFFFLFPCQSRDVIFFLGPDQLRPFGQSANNDAPQLPFSSPFSFPPYLQAHVRERDLLYSPPPPFFFSSAHGLPYSLAGVRKRKIRLYLPLPFFFFFSLLTRVEIEDEAVFSPYFFPPVKRD